METEKISMDLDENDFLPSLCQTLRRLANYFKIPHHVMAQWKLEALWIWLTIFILDQSSRLLNIMKATEQLRYKNIFAGLYWFLLYLSILLKIHLFRSISCFSSLLIDSVSLGKSIQYPTGYQTMITILASSIIKLTWGHLEMTSERTFDPTY